MCGTGLAILLDAPEMIQTMELTCILKMHIQVDIKTINYFGNGIH